MARSPSPRGLEAERTNAREGPSSLVGRAAELASLAAFFAGGARLVSIVAPGGMGKTRLATRFALEHAGELGGPGGGGAWIADLTEARGPADIAARAGAALGVRLRPSAGDPDGITDLGAALAGRRRVLLVLDNFEHVVEHARATVGAWLSAAPAARFLVTTRVPLDLPGEQIAPLGGLATPDAPGHEAEPIARAAPPNPDREGGDRVRSARADAVELFVQRARQVRPDLPLDGPALAVIAEIVRRLDGIPLAIELAAARAFVLSLDEIRARLDAPLALLVRHRAEGRHGSMRRAIEDSALTLGEAERRCFAACSVFHGGFTLEAVDRVVAGERGSALAEVETLAARSLLQARGAPSRLSMYATIRELAAEHLAALPEAAVFVERHARHFARLGGELAREVRAQGGGPALALLEVELENLVAAHEASVAQAAAGSAEAAGRALELALAIDPVAEARGLSRLRAAVLDAALGAAGAAEETPGHRVAEATLARARAAIALGDLEVAGRHAGRALDLAGRLGDAAFTARAWLGSGEVRELHGEAGPARTSYERALEGLEGATGPITGALRAEAHARLAHVHRRAGALDAAALENARAAALFRGLDHQPGLARAQYEGAVVAFFRRDYDAARAQLEEALAVARRLGARDIAASAETALGSVLQELGEIDAALERHAAALVAFREIDGQKREGNTLYYLAGAHLERGDVGEALRLLDHARERVRGHRRYEALVAGCAAAARAREGDPARAEAELEAAEVAASACQDEPALRATLAIHRAHVRAARRPEERAALLAEARALASAHSCDDPRFALRVFAGAEAPRPGATLIVDEEGFRVGAAPYVSLARRAPLRALLRALAEHRTASPGEALSLDDLVAAGWPGERVLHEAAANRVRVAVATLRKLGLRDCVISTPRGYLLSPVVSLLMKDPRERR